MRKFALLSVALLLFAVLVVAFLSHTDSGDTRAPQVSQDQISVSSTTNSGGLTGLRLDKKLANLPQSAPRAVPPPPDFFSWISRPDEQRAVLFLTAALGLGLLTGSLLKRRTMAGTAYLRDTSSLSAPDLTDSSSNTGDLIAEATARHVARADELQEEIIALRDSIESHEFARESDQQRLSEHQATIEELRHEMRHTDELTNSLQRARQQEQLLASELEERNEIISNLHVDIDNWREKYSTRSTEFEDLDQQHKNTLQLVEQGRKDHQAESARLHDEQRHTDELTQSLEQSQQQEQLLAGELAERNQIITNLQSDIDNWREEWAARTKHIEELDQQIAVLTADLQQARDGESAAHQSAAELQQAREALLAEVDVLTPNVALVEDLRQQLEELDERYDIAMADKRVLEEALDDAITHAQQIPELESQLDSARETINEHTAAIEDARLQIAELQASYAELQEQKKHGDEQFSQLNSAHSEQSAALNEQMRLLGDSQSSGERQQQEIDELQARLGSLKAEAEASNADILELKTFLDQAHADLDRARQDHTDLQTKLAHEQTAKEELVNQKLALEEQLSSLDTELAATRNNSAELNDSVVSLRKDLDQMINKIHEKISAISALETELADSQSLLGDKENEIADLTTLLETEGTTILQMQEKIDAAAAIELRLSNWDNSLQTYKHDLLNKNRLIDELRDELTLATHTGTLLKAQIRNMDEQLETLFDVQTDATELAQVTAQLNADLQQQNETIANISAQNHENDENIGCFDEELQTLQNEYAQWQQRMEQSALAFQSLQDELVGSYAILTRLDELMSEELHHENYSTWSNIPEGGSIVDRLATITGQASFLRDSLGAATAENEILLSTRNEMLKLQEHVQLLQHALEDHQYDLQQEITARKQQEQKCQNYREKIVTLEAEIAARQSRIKALTTTGETAEEVIGTLRGELHTAQAQFENANTDLIDQGQIIARLNEQIIDLQSKHQGQLDLLKTRAQSIKDHFEQQRLDLVKRYQSSGNQLRSEHANLKQAHQVLHDKLNQQNEKLDNLQRGAEPPPVLTAEYTPGKLTENIPVLGVGANKAATDSGTPVAAENPLPAIDIPVLRDTVGKDEEQV